MLIAYTSDLHTDLCSQNKELLDAIAARVAHLRPDVFIVAGDLAETCSLVTQSLRRFSRVRARKLYLPGNHDLFVEGDPNLPGVASSRDKFEELLPRAAASADFEFLGLQPVQHDHVGIIGTPGWYDYSLRDPQLDCAVPLSHYRSGQWRGLRAYDNGHVFWPRTQALQSHPGQPLSVGGEWASDEEICKTFLRQLESQLEALGAVRKVLAVVHVLPFLEIVARGAFGDSPFYDAYLGSARIGARLRVESRLSAVITGHLHRILEMQLDHFRVGAHPVGDARKSSSDLSTLAEQRLGTLEL